MATLGFILLSTILLAAEKMNCQEAILHLSYGGVQKEYCLVYNQSWTPLARSLDQAILFPLLNLSTTTLCDPSSVPPEISPALLNGSALVVRSGECNISRKALVAQRLGAGALLVASRTYLVIPSANESEYAKVHIPLALMRYIDLLDTKQVFGGGQVQAQMFSPPQAALDPNMAVMLLIAVCTVALGGYWSGACERQRLTGAGADGGGGEEKVADSGDVFLYSPLKVVVFVGMMCLMLVLMYFFYTVLVYVFITIFFLASATALFSCFDAILDLLGVGTVRFSVRRWEFSVRSLILAAVCISIAVVWVVYRNEDRWIWILQDLLGIAFCLNFMKTISLSNFKICVILLSLLLIYDVFFVFITPYLTKNGVSIMVQVALGPDAQGEKAQGNVVTIPAVPQPPSEKLPVVMRLPRFSAVAQNLCKMQFSILGYGDIIIPGLLVAYCSRFDVWVNSSRKIYLVSCCIAYTLGMVVTFAVMLLMESGQPALLYLVPFTLLSSAAVAARRGEMKHFWTGSVYQVLDSSREPLLPEGRPWRSVGDAC
ncbi:signal peptide peptidase-like 2A isoform X2 [Gadus chalcogrammus]|uniref:signal peptide peptidase-like 2A isoform X2 n=1 Tax=Gadus chalcogrammus TaxID=1042646 RepID=UPI0024C49DBC|nr:signal peptide peptidase-like 2A isoform X2 [Gadus chalcogrammus]